MGGPESSVGGEADPADSSDGEGHASATCDSYSTELQGYFLLSSQTFNDSYTTAAPSPALQKLLPDGNELPPRPRQVAGLFVPLVDQGSGIQSG